MSRIDQINELLRQELGSLVSKEIPLENGLITISEVKCAPDLRNAKVLFSVLPENVTGTALRELRRHSSQFSNTLKKRLNLKFIPKFYWAVDTKPRHASEMEDYINKVIEEEKEEDEK
jgi:ribosome-binding factor A